MSVPSHRGPCSETSESGDERTRSTDGFENVLEVGNELSSVTSDTRSVDGDDTGPAPSPPPRAAGTLRTESVAPSNTQVCPTGRVAGGPGGVGRRCLGPGSTSRVETRPEDLRLDTVEGFLTPVVHETGPLVLAVGPVV